MIMNIYQAIHSIEYSGSPQNKMRPLFELPLIAGLIKEDAMYVTKRDFSLLCHLTVIGCLHSVFPACNAVGAGKARGGRLMQCFDRFSALDCHPHHFPSQSKLNRGHTSVVD